MERKRKYISHGPISGFDASSSLFCFRTWLYSAAFCLVSIFNTYIYIDMNRNIIVSLCFFFAHMWKKIAKYYVIQLLLLNLNGLIQQLLFRYCRSVLEVSNRRIYCTHTYCTRMHYYLLYSGCTRTGFTSTCCAVPHVLVTAVLVTAVLVHAVPYALYSYLFDRF